jgi:drug/metabolite transporter (DMT)-like permease
MRAKTLGLLAALGATIAWASAGTVARKHLRHVNAGTVTFFRFLIASAAFLVFLGVRGIPFSLHPIQMWVGIVVGAGYVLYNERLEHNKAARAAAVELASPFYAAALGLLILGEPISLLQSGGMALLFPGVAALSRREGDQ